MNYGVERLASDGTILSADGKRIDGGRLLKWLEPTAARA